MHFLSTTLAERKGLFLRNELVITKDPRFEEEFGQYPALYLDFSVSKCIGCFVNNADRGRNDVKNMISFDINDLLVKFRAYISRVARHLDRQGLFNNRTGLNNNEQQFLDGILNSTLPDSDLSITPFALTDFIFALTKRQVIVLVDEYDTPTSYAVSRGYFSELYP